MTSRSGFQKAEKYFRISLVLLLLSVAVFLSMFLFGREGVAVPFFTAVVLTVISLVFAFISVRAEKFAGNVSVLVIDILVVGFFLWLVAAL